MSKLLEQLRELPAFNEFEKKVKSKLVLENTYIQEFEPERDTFEEVDDEDGRHGYPYHVSDDEALEIATEHLVEDKSGLFSEFVTEELSPEITELARFLIKEMI